MRRVWRKGTAKLAPAALSSADPSIRAKVSRMRRAVAPSSRGPLPSSHVPECTHYTDCRVYLQMGTAPTRAPASGMAAGSRHRISYPGPCGAGRPLNGATHPAWRDGHGMGRRIFDPAPMAPCGWWRVAGRRAGRRRAKRAAVKRGKPRCMGLFRRPVVRDRLSEAGAPEAGAPKGRPTPRRRRRRGGARWRRSIP